MASEKTLALRSPKHRPPVRELWGGNGLPARTIGKGTSLKVLSAPQARIILSRKYRRHPDQFFADGGEQEVFEAHWNALRKL